jgi:hypothetical protein
MRRSCARLVIPAVIIGLFATGVGCQNNEIPLIEFPKGAPPAPPSAKADPNGPQGINTSKGDPSQMH